jgi:hypothetical protein
MPLFFPAQPTWSESLFHIVSIFFQFIGGGRSPVLHFYNGKFRQQAEDLTYRKPCIL